MEKELNTLYGLSKHCSSQNHLQDGGTFCAGKSFFGSRDGQHKVVCPPEPWARGEEGEGGCHSSAEVAVPAGTGGSAGLAKAVWEGCSQDTKAAMGFIDTMSLHWAGLVLKGK